MFYDIFGRNWEGKDEGESLGDMGEAPEPVKTASFIDYAADTYGSVVFNTGIWSLFLLTSTCGTDLDQQCKLCLRDTHNCQPWIS